MDGLIKTEVELIDSYDTVQIDKHTWYCMFNSDRELTYEQKYIPKFARVRKITLSSNGSLSCSCCLQNRFLIPCRHIININKGVFTTDDVCVRNSVLYAHKYGNARFPDDTLIFDQRMNSYTGPKYHHDIDDSMLYPLYDCKESINENLAYFHHCDVLVITILNYPYDEYKDLLPNYSEEVVDSIVCNVGFSEEHVKSTSNEVVTSVNNDCHVGFTNDAHPFLSPIFKEIVDVVGKEKELFSLAESKKRELLSCLFKERSVNSPVPNTTKANPPSEWVSTNLQLATGRPNKKQKYHSNY